MKRIVVIHGPNLGLLGRREPEVYGTVTLEQINEAIRQRAETLGVHVDFFQSDCEGALVTRIGEAAGHCDGLLINPAAYTHSSIALHDALKATALPTVEVHLSLPARRESFRHISYTAPACVGQVAGFGAASYLLALEGLIGYIERRQGDLATSQQNNTG